MYSILVGFAATIGPLPWDTEVTLEEQIDNENIFCIFL